MVRSKAAETTEKKVTPQRKVAGPKSAAEKKQTPEKAAEKVLETEVVQEEETAEQVEAAEVEETAQQEVAAEEEEAAQQEESTQEEEVAEENITADSTAEDAENEGEEGDEEIGGEEQDHAEDGDAAERQPLTEEDRAYINELLATKIKLSDDTEANIFSYGPSKPGVENAARPLVCHVCRVVERSHGIKTHLQGKRHKESLRRKTHNAERFKQPFQLFNSSEGGKDKQFNIYPGEDIETVTPEYEDRIVDRVEWEFKKIDDEKLLNLLSVDPVYEYNKTKPVIGLDYLLKMKDPKVNKSKRFCVLCEEYLQSDTYQHVTDIRHQATYIIKHFPKLYEKVHKGLKVRNPRAKEHFVRNVFRKLYRKIEIKHGFKKMIPVDFSDFKALRSRYVNKVRRMPHYGEDTLEFTEAEVNVLIKKCNNGIPFNDPDPPTLRGTKFDPKRRKRVASVPEGPVNKSRRIAGDHYREWGAYKDVKDESIERLREKYKKYEDNPQSHPNYQKEWSEFWHQRCDQLKKENVNPDTYNFDQEWLPYFERRLRKLYLKEVTERKRALRTQYGLPLSRRTPEPFTRREPSTHPMNNQPQRGPRPTSNHGNFGSFNMNRTNNPPSLFASQPDMGDFGGFGGPVPTGPRGDFGGRQRSGNRNIQQPQQQHQIQQPSRKRPAPRREPVTVISVLSLLTALEDQLGSLGPKSVQLLSKAVLCEKNNQMNQLLTDNEYYILFATAKEKLKGQILANVIDRSKIEAANNAIEDLGKMINVMDKETRKQGNNPANTQNASGRNTNFGGDNFGRNNNMNAGGFGNDTYKGGNNSSNFGSGGGMPGIGNYRNEDNFRGNGGNFQGDSGNYRGDSGNYRNDGGNYRNDNSNFRNDSGNFGNDTTSYRSDNSNLRNESGNYGGNFRSMDDGGNNYRGFDNDSVMNRSSNFESGNYRASNEDGGYRGINDSNNFSSANMSTSNYRSNDMGNARGGNFNDGGTGNYRSNTMGGNSLGGSTISPSYRGGNNNTASGNYGSGGGSFGTSGNSSSLSFSRNFPSDTSEYRSGGNFDTTKFAASNYGSSGAGNNNNNSSAQRGSWMGGSGNVYSNVSKPNTNVPAFSSGMGYQQSTSMSAFNRNTGSNFNAGNSGGNYRRYN